jgi:HEPN domain-containing protein
MNRSHELAQMLLQKASEGARAMHRLMEDELSADWIVGFHAQQAVEKAIKAVLSEKGIEHPFTHDIMRLMELLPTASIPFPPDAGDLPALSPYGAILRYEKAQPANEPLNRTWAKECVQRTLEWARKILE